VLNPFLKSDWPNLIRKLDFLLWYLSYFKARTWAFTHQEIENDAMGAYDRIMNNLVLLILRKLGFPGEVSKCLGDIWDNVTHKIKTIYGIATPTYYSTTEQPLYGPGQGSTCGPPFYAVMYILLIPQCHLNISSASGNIHTR